MKTVSKPFFWLFTEVPGTAYDLTSGSRDPLLELVSTRKPPFLLRERAEVREIERGG
jgi:hypothetical protein